MKSDMRVSMFQLTLSFVTRTLPVCCGAFMCRDTRYRIVTACEVNYKVIDALIFF